jgi:uncharacterized protein DUF4058
MPSPFPGMDPYLERSRWFRGLHNDLITLIQAAIQPLLPSLYFALTGELIWMEGSERHVDPDVDVLRPSSARRREDVEAGEEGGVATLVAQAEDEPIVVKSGVGSSFLPEKMNRHRITPTPDYAPRLVQPQWTVRNSWVNRARINN